MRVKNSASRTLTVVLRQGSGQLAVLIPSRKLTEMADCRFPDLYTLSSRSELTVAKIIQVFTRFGGIITRGLADIICCPERSEVGRKSPPEKLIIAVRVAAVVLSRIVHTGGGRVRGVKLLLAGT